MNVSVNGADLHYQTRGAGPACLVLSSIGTQPYARQMPAQLDEHLQLVFVDLRGGGRSTGQASDLTFEVLADDLEAIRQDLGVDRIAVLGHSIQSILAIEYGRRRPDSVSHVIAVGAPPIGDMTAVAAAASRFFEADASEERKGVLRDNLANLPADATFAQSLWAQTPMRFFDPRFDVPPLFAEAELRPELLQHLMGTLTPAWDVTVDAGSLQVPILLAHGRTDYVVPYILWEGVADKLPGATLEIFERSGHQPFVEEPDRFVAAVTDWMARQR